MTTEYRKTRVCLGMPWYDGPDVDTFALYHEIMHHFGRLEERSCWLQCCDMPDTFPADFRLLDRVQADGDRTEITKDDGLFEFMYADEEGLSLPGLARERVVDKALELGSDYVFFWDDDMKMPWSAFLRLWRHQKPVVAALAFTAREPIAPVIYRMVEERAGDKIKYRSEHVLDYPKGKLISDEDVGGAIAFGAGVVLIHTNVFRQIPKPWFHSTGCGEDFMFCVRCYLHNIPRYVDTSLKTLHKAKEPRWYGEAEYEEMRKENPAAYERLLQEQW